jgi:NADH-quinone oxidoreductase subunit C
MTEERINLIKSKLEKFDVEYFDVNGTPAVITNPQNIIGICSILKDDKDLCFNMLKDELGIDNFTKKNRFEVICYLYSTITKEIFFVKVILDSKNPEMPTLTDVWKSANWYEREIFDMYGIKFTNHPDLRRIYMPDEFEYFPLRKDFPLMGIPGSIPLPKK